MNIRELREKRGLKQENIAVALNLDRSTIAKWESGEALPRADKLPRLAEVLDCSIDELFDTILQSETK